MNFLTPIFLVGALAVVGPIVFHLIRRAARERMPFSSLMFLRPTPPRTVRRSRLEHIFLLILRCLCLALLALAFARPFFSNNMSLPDVAGEGRQIIVLLDTSASMRRAGVWEKARAMAARYVDQTKPADEVAVMTFDRQLHGLVSFAEWNAWGVDQRTAMAKQRLASATPGWMGTQLGFALTSAAEDFPNRSAADKAPKSREVVLISDLQEGAKLDGLQGHEWPKDTGVVIEKIDGKRDSNAGLEVLEPAPDANDVEHEVHVRVANSGNSSHEKFRLGWSGASDGMDIYLPAGQSRTFTAPKLANDTKTGKLELTGDDEEFDNASYFAAPELENVAICYFGADSPNDSTKLLYYLERAFPATPRRKINFVPADALNEAAFAVVPGKLSSEESAALHNWLAGGKSALMVLTNVDAGPTLASVLGVADVPVTEATGDYALLGEIDFKHPIFAPFDDPRFSDFSHIHFWKHRIIKGPAFQMTMLAKFDDDSPALAQVKVGKGHLLVLTSGWDPVDSQFAVSSKFAPLMQTMLQWSGSSVAGRFQYRTGDAIPSPIAAGDAVQWQKPDGAKTNLPAGVAFLETDTPGIYKAGWAGKQRQFAVNLPIEESRIAPLAVDELARLGIPLGVATEQAEAVAKAHQRHVQESELENRQKLWRWLILGALVFALGEILLSGWLARRVTIAEAPA